MAGKWTVDDGAGGALLQVEERSDGTLSLIMSKNPLVVSPDNAEEFRHYLGVAIGRARWTVHSATVTSGAHTGWRGCGCGCAIWHKVLADGALACFHYAVDLSDQSVPWVTDPTERCRDCLLAAGSPVHEDAL